MRLNPFFMPVLVVGALLGTVFTAQALGQWSISGRTSVDAGQLAPADIKGWMTLQQVMDGASIPAADLYALMAIPADIPPGTALKDLEALVSDFEVSVLRERLAAWQAGGLPAETPAPAALPATAVPAAEAVTPLPTVAAPPTALPTVAPTEVSHTGAGAGSGAGPTPLPAGQILPADQIKGRLTLAEISGRCAVPLDRLLAALGLPAETDPALKVKDLISQGLVAETTTVQAAVAALQAP